MASVSRPTCRPLIAMSARSRSALAASSNEGRVAPAWTILASTEGLEPWGSSRRLTRWGEKVPAAGGAVGDGLVQGDGGPARDDLARPLLHGAGLPAGGARQLVRESLGLPPRELFECSARQSA